ncbi:Signal recognition particle subunit SRP72 [Pseudocercospora fuligena]|uniref:Signal recognition particle subunit SRP72 n=1 Tax=Pseudocercospora fuligena TaxID=685502 RepID=A0A8H6R8M9_9PEZI|nr:Signal recognition particle subunit SRP72 [Pseudocercospora fuligena]
MSLPSLTSLLKQTNIDDDEQVLQAADAALKQSKGNLEANHVKVVALLKLDRFEDALKALDAGGETLKEIASLEHAYALYKSGSPEAAAELAKKGTQRGSKHVEAQSRYRIEDFSRAAELYRELASNPANDIEADLRINSGATDAQLEWAGRGDLVEKKKPGREDLEAFETAYNAACGSIARGELAQGEVLLKRASDLCTSLDDLSEEEKQAELLPIKVQRIYVLERLGRIDEAAKIAQDLDTKAISEPVTRHIAQVNAVSSNPAGNPFIAQRLLSKDLSSHRDHPFRFQDTILSRSRYASDLQALKYDGTAASTNEIIKKQASLNVDAFFTSLAVINAAAHARSQTGKEALKHILPVLERRPNDVGLVLVIVQLYVLTGNSSSAIELVEKFLARLEQAGDAEKDIRFAPGVVGVAASLYDSQGRKGHVRTELAKAASYWRRKSKDRPVGYVHLAKAAGSALLESQDAEHIQLANDIFSELHSMNPDDRYAAAGLLAASPDKAGSKDLANLTPIDRLISGIDVDSLENAGVAQLPSSGAAPVTRKRPAEDTKPKKAKKLRKSRIPKDYDPAKKPDPERWLPLRDRSTYRPKGKKAKARQALFSQGAVANDSDGSRPATPGGEVVKQQQQKQGQNKKKKGKGGKW